MTARHLVIVGASLAGLRAAESLRYNGFTGRLTVVGGEAHPPYDRPPLSKQLLTSDTAPDPALPVDPGLGVEWRLGTPAVRLQPDRRTITLADGTSLYYDGVLVATGAHARGWPDPTQVPDHGVVTLRTRDDATTLRAHLRPGRRLVVVGGGFLGSEVAASARARGVEVVLVHSGHQPLDHLVGTAAGSFVAALHRAAGIDLRADTTVARFRSRGGHVTGVELADGTALSADVVLLALGAVPATGWLTGSGLDIEQGVRCDRHLRALDVHGAVVPGVVAAGDVARVPQPLAGGRAMPLGHWSNAVEQGTAAARTLLAPDDSPAFTGVPSFWSDLHGARIRSVGLPALHDEIHVHEHDPEGRRLDVSYHRNGHLVGALTANRTGRLAAYRRQLLSPAPGPAAIGTFPEQPGLRAADSQSNTL